MERIRIDIRGVVQGVGFRPYVYGLAARLGLAGTVNNGPAGVRVEIEGPREALDAFLAALRESPPPLARIQEIAVISMASKGEAGFAIVPSECDGERTVLIAPDIATCNDCLRELDDPHDRRYRYPLINCVNCGPRYTIIRDVPYDRARTTMAEFAMCPACRTEYEDPANRRFHAEPTCCQECGPKVVLLDRNRQLIAGDDPIEEARRRIADGEIVAVKGIGGFHLACDATNAKAVRLLRARKHRDLKPFALMTRDLDAARAIAQISEEEARMLSRPERPILLLAKREGHGIAEEVAPRSASFGVMLPYTPLHHLLLAHPSGALVMTSGNLSDEPIAYANEDGFARLSDLADCFLVHDRAIHIRTDDSVARAILGTPRFLRRSRGYAPFPVRLPAPTRGHEWLAVGAELSNTICVTREGQAFLSHHLGDLENLAAYESFVQAVAHLERLLEVAPHGVACDLHPSYASTRFARHCGLPVTEVQHHHAHIASVLAETGRTDRVIGVAFDGMGWGSDGTAWGGEFLVCDLDGYERRAHLEPLPQPGGDATAKRPARMGYVYLREAFGERAGELAREILPALSHEECAVIDTVIERGVHCPMTSSMGRLFDAASALLGVCDVNTYHAQAPIELEAVAARAASEQGSYTASLGRSGEGAVTICATDILRSMVEDSRRGVDAAVCAARFHNAIALVTRDVCRRIREDTGLETAALSGGVFANAFLLERAVHLLEQDGFEVLLNALAPPGDGGICLGQAAVAAWRCACA